MANIWEQTNSILMGNLYSDLSYLVTTVQAGNLDQMLCYLSLYNAYQYNFEGYTFNIAVGTEHIIIFQEFKRFSSEFQ